MARTRVACSSIYDLARQTGFSTSTVSRALNQRGRLSEKTRLKVLKAARAAGFRPRASVRQNTIAIVMDRMRYATYGGFVASMLSHLIRRVAGYQMAIEVYTEENANRLGTRFIDGVLALTWDDRTISQLRSLAEVPVVLINRGDIDNVSAVLTDHYDAGRLVGRYLAERGHRRIGFVAEEEDWGARQRVEGLKAAVQQAGSDGDEVGVWYTGHAELRGALGRAVDAGVTALFLGGEDLAVEAGFLLASTFGVRIPDDLSVIGMENSKVSPFMRPPMTTLAQPLDELAETALDLVQWHIEEQDRTPRRQLLGNELIERGSVRRLHHAPA